MKPFPEMPIQRKLTLVILLTTTVALLLASMAMISHELLRYRKSLVRELSTQARLIAANSAVALAFHDPRTAREILEALRGRPEIVHACLYETDGKVLAEYVGGNSREPFPPPEPLNVGHRFDRGYLLVFHRVKLGADPVGSIYLRADLREEHVRLWEYAAIVLVVMCASLLVAVLLSARLQRIVSEPILGLARVARAVTDLDNYGLRAEKQSNDEIGELTDGFNQMLTQVQKRDEELRASEHRFRQVTETIREVFWMINIDNSQMIYISPGYEEVWGRTCQSLYAQPTSWMDAIHPEDRERVRQATLTKLTRGDYDEEYRIIRPDGAVLWIRDRAFPVRDESGNVYRVVGVADDITERKRLERQILEISDREQGRIGQDLHDGLCQHLVGVAFSSNLLAQKLAAHHPTEAKAAGEIAALLDDAISQARQVARGLYPVKLEAEGLTSALHELAVNVSARFQVACTMESPEPVPLNDNTMATHLYRIVQEAVNNALKHAKPKRIVIRLAGNNGKLTLTVTDDGLGISHTTQPSPGMGLHIMHYRARMIGGTLDVQSPPEGGTIIACSLPRKSST